MRHCIDAMHIGKNVYDCIVCTFLSMKKNKDHKNRRANVNEMGLKPELVHEVDGQDLPPSTITLSKMEKELCEFLKSVKVPTGYSKNIGAKVLVAELKLKGKSKSHTCHVMLTALLAMATRNILPLKV